MRILLAAVLMLFGTAMASTLTLKWDIPNQRVSGEPMTPEEISHYALRCSVSGGPPTSMDIPAMTPDGSFSGALSDILPTYGVYDCEMAVVDTWGLSSDYVVVENGPVKYLPAAPGVPTNVLILVE